MRIGVEGEESESETKFDHLVSVTEMVLNGNFLSRVPSVKNMRSLQSLFLADNKITMLGRGDFLGATQLVNLELGNNHIVSAATEAFANLASFRVAPEAFNPTNSDGSPVLPVYGVGACHACNQTEPLPFLCNAGTTVRQACDLHCTGSVCFCMLTDWIEMWPV